MGEEAGEFHNIYQLKNMGDSIVSKAWLEQQLDYQLGIGCRKISENEQFLRSYISGFIIKSRGRPGTASSEKIVIAPRSELF